MNGIRRQLTLFVEQEMAGSIEAVRQKFNPVQSALIKSHVTLCREDEIADMETVVKNLSNLTVRAVEIEFGKPARFDNGKGVLLPALPGYAQFRELRRQILIGLSENPREQEPHITLIHPRNSTCTDDVYNAICKFDFPARILFRKIDIIEQIHGGPWKVLQTFPLAER